MQCKHKVVVPQVAPGISPTLLERIVQARSDLSKADAREVMLECREVFASKHSSDTSDAVLPAKGKNTTTPFKVALAAAKRRPGSDGTPGVSNSKSREKAERVVVPVLPKSPLSQPQKPKQPVMISGIPKLEMV